MLVDLWRLFGERTGVEIEFRLVDWAASLEALETGGADVHGGLTPTRTRTELFDFSTPILRVGTLLFMPRGDGIRHLGDLEGDRKSVV